MSSTGFSTPGSVESVVPVHPTSERRPHAITVQSENTSYTDEYITSKFVNRGSAVQVVDGQYIVKPVAQEFLLQTQRKVSKTGYVVFFYPYPITLLFDAYVPLFTVS